MFKQDSVSSKLDIYYIKYFYYIEYFNKYLLLKLKKYIKSKIFIYMLM